MKPLGPRTARQEADYLAIRSPLVKQVQNRTTPLWKGPQEDGLTYSMICKYLQCKHRFWLKTVQGLAEPDEWNAHMHYGSMFHAAEEARIKNQPWLPALQDYYRETVKKYEPNERDITKWYLLCKMQFPLYINHWAKHQTELGRKTVMAEKSFRVQHRLPSGYVITLRGKIDHLYSQNGFLYVMDTKTKGEIDQVQIGGTLDQNLQCMLYHLAIRLLLPPDQVKKIAGTVYNVIRRPLSDRRSVKMKKNETETAFNNRVRDQILENTGYHFMRPQTPIDDRHMTIFLRNLNPLLQEIVDWWQGFGSDFFNPWNNPRHFQFPFGVYHSMERGYRGDYFRLLSTGSKAGLQRINNLYPEL